MVYDAAETKVSEGAERQLVKTNITRRVQASMRSNYLVQLGTLLPIACLYYLFLSIAHYFVLTGQTRLIMMGLSVAAIVLCLGLFVALRKGKLRARRAHQVSIPLALIVIANIFTHVVLTGDQIELTNAILALTAFGFLSLHPVMYSFFVGLIVVLYVVCLNLVTGPYTENFAFAMVGALVVGATAFINRYRTLRRQTRLAIENATKARILSRMHQTIGQHAADAEQAARVAEAASEAKSRFLANTSHELRTPLTGVLGMVDLLQKSDMNGEQREMLSAIKTSARGLLTVLNDILDFAKLEEGGLILKEEPFQAHVMVQRVVNMLKVEADAKDLNLQVDDIGHHDIWLLGDGVRIGQILFNFVSNAIKFTHEGSVRITGSLTPGDQARQDARQTLTFSVVDTGIGIAEEHQATLFERFTQIDNASDRKSTGTGLGLAIAKEIADMMGASISVESEPGAGSIFTFKVDLDTAEAPALDSAEKESDAADRPLRLLVAEDNAINQLLIKKLLNKSGWVVTLVTNGKQALDAAIYNPLPFDLVLMDIQMPEMDGVTALGEMQEKLSSCPPVIALTANTSEDDIAFYRDAGFDGFVGKPIDADALIKEMDKALTADKIRRAVSREEEAKAAAEELKESMRSTIPSRKKKIEDSKAKHGGKSAAKAIGSRLN